VVGLATAIGELVAEAHDHLDETPGEGVHVMLPACPEHVVDAYRGRLTGIRMAWRVPLQPPLASG